MTLDEFDNWCLAASGLQRDAEGNWAAAHSGEVSFPEEAHADLAVIEDSSYWFAHRNAVIASIVGQFPPGGTIFDVGGGNGFVSRGLSRAGQDCVVIEPGIAGVRVARQRGLKAIHSNFEALLAPPESIPAIGLFDVLEHIEDAGAALSALNRSLCPGGMIYVAVPAFSFLWSVQDSYGGHFRRYTLGGLARNLRQSGFDPLFGTYFFSSLVAPVFLLRTLPSALGFRRGENAASNGANEHRLPAGAIGRALQGSFEWEARRISAGRTVPVGASCVIAARKISGI